MMFDSLLFWEGRGQCSEGLLGEIHFSGIWLCDQ